MRDVTRGAAAGAVTVVVLTGCAAAGPAQEPSSSAGENAAAPPAEVPDEGCSGPLSSDVTAVQVEVAVKDGRVEPAPDRVEVPLGATVVLRAEADVPAEIHVHGYDVAGEAGPGHPACLEVLADVPGVYDVEAHPETLLLQLVVR
ncbi:cupredoxin domain-containing protein [Promicromonospora thailandica]|uniref:cupredoxin domain-containing protein n=1 Tax=Promicromonospora thailandica TaxID=765201 RepID=UPI0020A3C82F|nr:cupredoxin domain-containing protein [Promicromonospora thailandica]